MARVFVKVLKRAINYMLLSLDFKQMLPYVARLHFCPNVYIYIYIDIYIYICVCVLQIWYITIDIHNPV